VVFVLVVVVSEVVVGSWKEKTEKMYGMKGMLLERVEGS
jgi:hypothetical protein